MYDLIETAAAVICKSIYLKSNICKASGTVQRRGAVGWF